MSCRDKASSWSSQWCKSLIQRAVIQVLTVFLKYLSFPDMTSFCLVSQSVSKVRNNDPSKNCYNAYITNNCKTCSHIYIVFLWICWVLLYNFREIQSCLQVHLLQLTQIANFSDLNQKKVFIKKLQLCNSPNLITQHWYIMLDLGKDFEWFGLA